MNKIIIATKNAGKVREFKTLLPMYEILSLTDIGFSDEIVENGQSFSENAVIKASVIAKKYNTVVISDDSGLEVFSLNNEPGIYSARYAGEQHNDDDNNKLLVEKLKNVVDKNCRYVCAIAAVKPNGEAIVEEDYCYGEIILEPRGAGGFGYDPYFYLPEYQKTMAEISLEEKNKISHRAKAIRKMVKSINDIFNS